MGRMGRMGRVGRVGQMGQMGMYQGWAFGGAQSRVSCHPKCLICPMGPVCPIRQTPNSQRETRPYPSTGIRPPSSSSM